MLKDAEKLPVYVDTNILLSLYEKANLIDELERMLNRPFVLVVTTAVIDELNLIKKKRSKKGMAARLALQLIERWEKEGMVKIVDVRGKVDDVIVELANKHNAAVCTNDVGVVRRLKPTVRCFSLKNNSTLSYAR